MEDDTSTFVVRTSTPFAQVPRWIIRAGKDLSQGARSLYADIMTYADNDQRSAFPSQQRLADDLGVSERSIRTYMGELEAFGALEVERRRNRKTGNFYANHYVLAFTDPRGTGAPRREGTDAPVTTPTTPTTPTSPTPSPLRADADSSLRSPSLSERRSDLLEAVKEISRATTDDDYEAASENFIAAFEDAHGEDIGFWDYGWSSSLDRHVRDHGIDYGSAKWLSIFTNTRNAA